MRIGVITTSYPRWPGDSAGSFVEGHVRALRALGHEVDVIAAGDATSNSEHVAPQSDGRARGIEDGARDTDGPVRMRLVELRETERRERARRDVDIGHLVDLRDHERRERERRDSDAPDAGVRVTRVRARSLFYRGGAPDTIERAPLRAMLAAASFVPRFAATVAMRARRWDHVIAHWLAPSALAAIPTGKPLTAIAHGGDVHMLRRLRLLAATIAALRARGTRLVFVSEHLRALANARDAIVQPMGLDLSRFAALGCRRAPTTPPTVLFVGRLVPIKGVDTLIEAMLQLPDMQLVIAGEGPERRALEARALANRSRGAQIGFVGEVETNRRDELLRQASVVVVPSRVMPDGRAEGCPMIALEALASGVPVASTIGRATEIVMPDDPTALADAIRRVTRMRCPKTTELVADLGWLDVARRLLRSE